jgi:hypothetical protein
LLFGPEGNNIDFLPLRGLGGDCTGRHQQKQR